MKAMPEYQGGTPMKPKYRGGDQMGMIEPVQTTSLALNTQAGAGGQKPSASMAAAKEMWKPEPPPHEDVPLPVPSSR